jgi:hypothetical protein
MVKSKDFQDMIQLRKFVNTIVDVVFITKIFQTYKKAK